MQREKNAWPVHAVELRNVFADDVLRCTDLLDACEVCLFCLSKHGEIVRQRVDPYINALLLVVRHLQAPAHSILRPADAEAPVSELLIFQIEQDIIRVLRRPNCTVADPLFNGSLSFLVIIGQDIVPLLDILQLFAVEDARLHLGLILKGFLFNLFQ